MFANLPRGVASIAASAAALGRKRLLYPRPGDRKLASAIREQNWFTVLLEIIIVVVGIFLGLQVDGWNQWHTDRTLEQTYLERLHADAKMAVNQQREFRRWNNVRLRTEEVVLEALRSGVLPEDHRVAFQH